MSFPSPRVNGRPLRLPLFAFVVIALVAAGCALDKAYRHADWLIVWKVDHYLDLTSEQKASLGHDLAPMLARHRSEALPVYEAFLRDIHHRAARGLTREDLDWIFARYHSLRTDVVEQLIGQGTVLLVSVDDKQIEHFEGALQKDRRKAERLLKSSKEERLAKRAADTMDFVEEWLGSVMEEQKAKITAMSYALPDLRVTWEEYQRQAQQELLKALRAHANSDVVATKLRAWFLSPEQHAPQAYRRSRELMHEGTKDMVVAIDRMATSKQRTHALNKLQGLIDTVHELQVS